MFSGEYGTYVKRLESELVEAFEEYKKKRRKPIRLGVSIGELIESDESESVEFKGSMCWDYKEKRKNKLIEHAIAKTVAALMNSKGGYLIIGVGDDKEILGLDKDFKVIKRATRDAYELHFTNLINKYLGKENRPRAKMWFDSHKTKTIAIVKVEVSPSPVYLKCNDKEEIYIRLGNSSHPLNVREATKYIKDHWQ